MNTYLVTGAAGFIGSHTVDRLLAQGHRVIGVDNLRTGRMENLSEAHYSARFEFIQQDIVDAKAMESLFQDRAIDGVLHLAALVSVPESMEEPDQNFSINLEATDSIGRLCARHNVKRVVFASSSAVYGDEGSLPLRETSPLKPLSPYAAAKLASEVMLLGYGQSYGLEIVCFRYFNVYGPRQNPGSPYSGVLSIFTQRYKSKLPVTVFGDGEQTRDFISVSDVVEANCRALTNDEVQSGCYNVCTGNSFSLNQVLQMYARLFPGGHPPRYGLARTGDIRHSKGDPGKLWREFLLKSRLDFKEGLAQLVESLDE